MGNIDLLTDALAFIEKNLTGDLRTEEIAHAVGCSKSTLDKLFRYWNHISVRDYIIRRRMSRAARDLTADPGLSLLTLAVSYGYGSNEAFTRAFAGVWHVTPSEYRKAPHRAELYPGLRIEPKLLEDEAMNGGKKVDISELYDLIRARNGCCIVCADIVRMKSINGISRKAGDLSIINALRRMEDAAGPEDVVFRVGADQFVILTDSRDTARADEICGKISARNGECFQCEGQEIPLSLYLTEFSLEERHLNYAGLFSRIQTEINLSKGK